MKSKWVFLMSSSCGGFLLSQTGLSIGWMLGTLIAAAALSFFKPVLTGENGMPKSWLSLGQLLLGIELGQKLNLSVLTVFRDDWLIIGIMLFLSIGFSLLAGIVLWKWSHTDMMTSFFSTAPGGLSAMPGIAEEVGANTAVVSILQTMRVFLVVFTVPAVVSLFVFQPSTHLTILPVQESFEWNQLLWTMGLVLIAYGGYRAGKKMQFPAPWLLGSMLATAIVQSAAAKINITAFWPEEIMIVAQVLIAASIGSRFHKKMFAGLAQTILVSFISTILFIASMFACAYAVSKTTGLDLTTAVLAFAPGGIAEMAATAVILKADTTFVVAVQVLRIIAVILILPTVFKILYTKNQ